MQRRTFLTTPLVASAMVTRIDLVAYSEPGKPTSTHPFVVKAGEARSGVHTPFRGINANDVKVSGKDTGGHLAVFEYIGQEKVGPVLHVHHQQDEVFFIVEGEYLFQIGPQQMSVTAGDTVFAPRGIPHSWVQLSEQGKQVYMLQPAGQFEEFLRKLTQLKEPPTQALLEKLHQQHGMSVLGPPLEVK